MLSLTVANANEVAIESPDRPFVVFISTQDCDTWVVPIRQTLKDLKAEFGKTVDFRELDASPSRLSTSRIAAKKLNILNIFIDSIGYATIVLVISGQRKLVQELVGPKDRTKYKQAIERALQPVDHPTSADTPPANTNQTKRQP